LGPSWLSGIQWNLSIEDTIGTQLAVLYTVEPLYSGHHWHPAGCPVYSGNLSIEDTIGTQLAVLYREVSLIHRYVDVYTGLLCGWAADSFLLEMCPYVIQSVIQSEIHCTDNPS